VTDTLTDPIVRRLHRTGALPKRSSAIHSCLSHCNPFGPLSFDAW